MNDNIKPNRIIAKRENEMVGWYKSPRFDLSNVTSSSRGDSRSPPPTHHTDTPLLVPLAYGVAYHLSHRLDGTTRKPGLYRFRRWVLRKYVKTKELPYLPPSFQPLPPHHHWKDRQFLSLSFHSSSVWCGGEVGGWLCVFWGEEGWLVGLGQGKCICKA